VRSSRRPGAPLEVPAGGEASRVAINRPSPTLYGFEADSLNMELVEGETLSARIVRGGSLLLRAIVRTPY